MHPTPPNLLLTEARLVTPDEVFAGTLELRAGRIGAIGRGGTNVPSAIRLGGAFLLPGLVDLHTDNFERAIEPRTGARIPGLAAMAAHDRETAASGVTTVFDALCLTDEADDAGRADSLGQGLAALRLLRAGLRAEHFLHLRVELPARDIAGQFDRLAEEPGLRLVSLMDHTPGKKQFADVAAWRALPWNRRRGAEELARIEHVFAAGAERVPHNRRAVLARLAGSDVVLASHDDRTEAHVAEAIADGIRIAEFPVTLEAARAAHEAGMAVLGGAPNVVRGGSHSGNLAVAELAERGLLDALASDYVPSALIEAMFRLHQTYGLALADACRMVSDVPARLAGLGDRGRLEVGCRADLVAANWLPAGAALIEAVWREGVRIA
ncbi:MAG: alpha-D-ribose 1-methylphosphonate 5-triphosphate diphosphatase [Acetobacteraceae bacterium]|nr:alpha-D-ribose 1-methylphosphonate 5-triphosphate diphosphatase [Acetobacteraceae bacterium]